MCLKPICCGLLAALAATPYAYLRLPAIFGDGMVLQRGERTAIYGYAAPRQRVVVRLDGVSAQCEANEHGRWRAELDLSRIKAPASLDVRTNSDHIVLQHVLVGEVWICSGQSNMEWSYHQAKLAGQQVEIGNPVRPALRLFKVQRTCSDRPGSEVQGLWAVCSPQSVNDFSLLGYLFGANLQDRLGGPIGIIESDWGGTPAEAWTPRSVLDQVAVGESPAVGTPAKKPEQGPAVLYNAMIHPLLAGSFRGVLWYQGESNVGQARRYREIFPAMIQSWRSTAGREFPFLFVQLANYSGASAIENQWAELRQAQLAALTLPRTAMATAADLSRDGSIHRIDREDLALRLAWVALHEVYDRPSAFSGPVFAGMTALPGQLRLEFSGKLNALVLRANVESGFEVAGDDRVWHKAFARIESGVVVVSSPKVLKPVAVRYGWGDSPELSLYNSAGLPAIPFRTDDWGN